MSSSVKRAARYSRSDVRAHLASQYVLGTLSSRAKRRMESLLLHDAEWEREVFQWQSHLEQLHMRIDEVRPPDRVWAGVRSQLDKPSTSAGVALWQSVLMWRGLAAVFALAAVLLWVVPSPVPTQSASYLALMQPSDATDSEAHFVLAAYQGAQPGQSRLQLQWNKHRSGASLAELTLWAVSRETGERQSLGLLSEIRQGEFLSASEWKAIAGSAELLLTQGASPESAVVFRGPCLQLAEWANG